MPHAMTRLKNSLIHRPVWAVVVFLLADAVCLGADPTEADRSDSPETKQPKRMTRHLGNAGAGRRVSRRNEADHLPQRGRRRRGLGAVPARRSPQEHDRLSARLVFLRRSDFHAKGRPRVLADQDSGRPSSAALGQPARHRLHEPGRHRGPDGPAPLLPGRTRLPAVRVAGRFGRGLQRDGLRGAPSGEDSRGHCDGDVRYPGATGFRAQSDNPVLQKLATTVFAAYGGTPEEKPDLYQARSVLAHTDRLTMPVILTMGENDQLIPVAETRKIAAAMKGKSNFVYHEIPQGGHDSALWVDIDLETLQIRNEFCQLGLLKTQPQPAIPATSAGCSRTRILANEEKADASMPDGGRDIAVLPSAGNGFGGRSGGHRAACRPVGCRDGDRRRGAEF